jgi:hypothetical protein
MTYLFRIDGAKDNDEFFAAMCSSVSHVYAGADFRVGAVGWIPDLVKIVVEEPLNRCSLTLIELEATESAALVSCRKYLPENSAEILSAFSGYLDRVIRQCRSTADLRESEFARLKDAISQVSYVTISTAGGLRSSTRLVEELLLIDQPKLVVQPQHVQHEQEDSRRTFRGVVRLTRLDAEALARCVMILDAVIRRCDHSGTRFEIWIRRARSQPLKRLLTENKGSHPALRSLVLAPKHAGVTLDFEQLLSEVIEVWLQALRRQPNQEQVRTAISCYFPLAAGIKGHESMTAVFETARSAVVLFPWPSRVQDRRQETVMTQLRSAEARGRCQGCRWVSLAGVSTLSKRRK